MTDLTVIRHPKRGKAHRQSMPAPPGFAGDTDCGKWARDMSEVVPLAQTAPEDRCKRCWPADTTPPATNTPARRGSEGES